MTYSLKFIIYWYMQWLIEFALVNTFVVKSVFWTDELNMFGQVELFFGSSIHHLFRSNLIQIRTTTPTGCQTMIRNTKSFLKFQNVRI